MQGKPIAILGDTYFVPEATVALLELVQGYMGRLQMAQGPEAFSFAAEVIAEALRENYPDLTSSDVKRKLRLSTAMDAMKAVLVAAGFSGAEKGEAGSP